MNPIKKSFKVLQTLGFRNLWYFLVYKIGLRTGHYQRMTPCKRTDFSGHPVLDPYRKFPEPSKSQIKLALARADEVREGFVRLFGGDPTPLDLSLGRSTEHWSTLDPLPPDQDIKLIWEPARFGWAIDLARAYTFSRDDRYASDFWEKIDELGVWGWESEFP